MVFCRSRAAAHSRFCLACSLALLATDRLQENLVAISSEITQVRGHEGARTHAEVGDDNNISGEDEDQKTQHDGDEPAAAIAVPSSSPPAGTPAPFDTRHGAIRAWRDRELRALLRRSEKKVTRGNAEEDSSTAKAAGVVDVEQVDQDHLRGEAGNHDDIEMEQSASGAADASLQPHLAASEPELLLQNIINTFPGPDTCEPQTFSFLIQDYDLNPFSYDYSCVVAETYAL